MIGTVAKIGRERTGKAMHRALKRLSISVGARTARRELASLPPTPYDRVARRVLLLGKRIVPFQEASWDDGVPVDEVELAARLDAMQSLELPLVLAGQIGRSGGTLMLRLLDAHPACLVIPHELGRMLPVRSLPRDPDEAFARLTPNVLGVWHRGGVNIGKPSLSGQDRKHTRPFDLQPALFRRLFVEAMRRDPPSSDRDVLNRYFTAYFAAWTNGPDPSGRVWIVGFEPSAVEKDGRMECFDANYPDGRVLVTLRDPWSWMVSARLWSFRFEQREVAIRSWLRSTRAAIARTRLRPDDTLLLRFDDLVLRTDSVMQQISAFLDMPFDQVLLAPTLNGEGADSNSSFPGVGPTGLSASPAVERRKMLSTSEEQWVTQHAGALWEEALASIAAS